MAISLKRRSSRNLLAGAVLIVAPALTVLIAKGSQKPWNPDSPTYRQKGNPAAKITIVEFSDFQCPSCAYAVEPVNQIFSLYSPNVRLVFKHHPWWFHRWAKTAALAAECAGKQGKFWEFGELLFKKQSEWVESNAPDKLFASYAQSTYLDLDAYAKCLADPATAALIAADDQEGKDHWINSTPTFFINGVRAAGSMQLRREGVREIERILGR